MTERSKDFSRLASRAESMRLAILASAIPQHWELADVEHMADAAGMLWDQANVLAEREPSSKSEMSEAIARIYEPLLVWTGHLNLAERLTRSREKGTTHKAPPGDASLQLFETLALKGRFHDDFPWQRQTSFTQAQDAFGRFAQAGSPPHAETSARAAFGWLLIGMEDMAMETLLASPSPKDSCLYFLESRAPQFWRNTSLPQYWLDSLREIFDGIVAKN